MQKILQIKQSNSTILLKSYKNFIKNNDNDFELIILTTAINRPSLHNISFNNYKEFMPKNINILWIINIDYVKFNDNSVITELSTTKDNILNIFSDFKNITFDFILNEKGNFNKAVRNITNYASSNISKTCKAILYLEDDWYSIRKFSITELINSNIDIIKLYNDGDPRKKLSFQPSIIKPHVWYCMFYQKLKKVFDDDIDPEKICQLIDEINNFNWAYRLINTFKDIGREEEFNDENTIRGWYQKTNLNSQNISLSYIQIDTLLKSIIYLQSFKTNFNKNQLKDELIKYLENIFMSQIINKILNKYKLNENTFFEQYLKCSSITDKKNTELKYTYDNIDKLLLNI